MPYNSFVWWVRGSQSPGERPTTSSMISLLPAKIRGVDIERPTMQVSNQAVHADRPVRRCGRK
jgi:hypothetical protein